MTTKDLDRINALMRLALNNPSEQESLRAALVAVRMIEKHKALRAADSAYQPSQRQQDFHGGQRGGKTQASPPRTYTYGVKTPTPDEIDEMFRRYQRETYGWNTPVDRDPTPPRPERSDEEKRHAKEAADKLWEYYEQSKARSGKTVYPPYDKEGNPIRGSRAHDFDPLHICRRCGCLRRYAVDSRVLCPL